MNSLPSCFLSCIFLICFTAQLFCIIQIVFPPHSIYPLYYLSCYHATVKAVFTFESMLITISTTCIFPCGFLLRLLLWLSWLRIHLKCGRPGFSRWLWKLAWTRKWLPSPVFWPGEFMDCKVSGVTKSWTRVGDFHFTYSCL